MRLVRITVDRLPGIGDSFVVDELSAGVNVIVGPNGSGKSSLCRAVRATLWPRAERIDSPDVATVWRTTDETELRARLADRVDWQRDGVSSGAPALPGDHLARCYTLGLTDLLDPKGRTDNDLVERLRIEMTGGYDLDAVASLFRRKRSYGRSEENDCREKATKLSRIEGAHRELAKQEDALPELEAALESAREAQRLLEPLDLALELCDVRRQITDNEVDLERFSPGMDALRGDEIERLEPIEDDLQKARQELRALDEELSNAAAVEAECALPEGPIEPEALTTWLARAGQVERLEGEEARARRDVAAAEALATKAAVALGRDRVDQVVPLEDLESVDAWWRDALALRERMARLQSRREDLPDREPADPDPVRRAVDALRAWLAAPAGGPSPPKWMVALGVAALITGAILAALVSPWLVIVAGVGIGLVGASLLFGRGRADERDIHRRTFESFGLEPPRSWQREDVRARLAELERDLVACERARDDWARRREVAADLQQAERDQSELEGRRRAIVEAAGLDPAIADLHLFDLANRLARHTEAVGQLAAAVAERGEIARQRADALEDVASFLRARGVDAPADGAAAEAALDALRNRSEKLRSAIETRRQVERRRPDVIAAIEEREGRREHLLRTAGVDTKDADEAVRLLQAHLDEREEWLEIRKACDELLVQEEQAKRKLAGHAALVDLDADELIQRRDEAQREADRAEALLTQIVQIEGRIGDAKAGLALEAARADLAEAERVVEERADDAVYAAAGAFVVDEVGGEYERVARPAVVDQARNWFAEFTGHRYELIVQTEGDDQGFRARDRESRAGLGLGALSDGTRIQLLLAARLAFATQEELGEPLPLFLDEVLTVSDPERFFAIVKALVGLAATGRQVFFLTCDPADVAAWREATRQLGEPGPRIIDLGAIRRLSTAVAGPSELEVAPPPAVPRPDGKTAEAYGAELGAPPPNPFARVDGIHLFHLLRDDLSLLYRVLSEARVDTIGRWRSFAEHPTVGRLFSERERRRIAAAIDVVEAVAEGWRRGRGRPVDRQVLANSEAVSNTFIDRVSELAADLGGDARALLDALNAREDERAKGFRTEKVEQLREYLIETGYLDPSPTLEPEAIRLDVHDRIRHRVANGDITRDAVDRMIDALQQRFDEVSPRSGGVG